MSSLNNYLFLRDYFKATPGGKRYIIIGLAIALVVVILMTAFC